MNNPETSLGPIVSCGIPGCNERFALSKMATLKDPNGKSWKVCPDCVEGIWARKPWTPETPIESIPTEWLDAVPYAVGSLQVIHDLLNESDTSAQLCRRMQEELDRLRNLYTRKNV